MAKKTFLWVAKKSGLAFVVLDRRLRSWQKLTKIDNNWPKNFEIDKKLQELTGIDKN